MLGTRAAWGRPWIPENETMGHGIEDSDRLVLAGEPAWHGLGTVVPRDLGVTVRQAARMALPWDVRLVPLFAQEGPGPLYERRAFPAQGVERYGPGEDPSPLCVVGPGFELLSNERLIELAAMAEERSGGRYTLEACGSIGGGRRVFILLRGEPYDVALGDTVQTYTAFLNGHDGSRKLRIFPTHIRIVCANTEAWAVEDSDAKGTGLAVTHRKGLSDIVDSIQDAIQAGEFLSAEKEVEDRRMAGTPTYMAAGYFRQVAEVVYPDPDSWPSEREDQRAAQESLRKRRESAVLAFWAEYEYERQNGIRGTVYGAYQSVLYWLDHERYKGKDPNGDRLLGRGCHLKRAARRLALELC